MRSAASIFASLYVCLATSSRLLTPACIARLLDSRAENITAQTTGTYPYTVYTLISQVKRPRLVCYILVDG